MSVIAIAIIAYKFFCPDTLPPDQWLAAPYITSDQKHIVVQRKPLMHDFCLHAERLKSKSTSSMRDDTAPDPMSLILNFLNSNKFYRNDNLYILNIDDFHIIGGPVLNDWDTSEPLHYKKTDEYLALQYRDYIWNVDKSEKYACRLGINQMEIFDTDTGKIVYSLQYEGLLPFQVELFGTTAYVPMRKSAADFYSLCKYDLESEANLHMFACKGAIMYSVSADQTRIAIARKGQTDIYDGKTYQLVDRVDTGELRKITLSPDGHYLLQTENEKIDITNLDTKNSISITRPPERNLLTAFGHRPLEWHIVPQWLTENRLLISRNGTCVIIAADTGKCLGAMQLPGYQDILTVSKDLKHAFITEYETGNSRSLSIRVDPKTKMIEDWLPKCAWETKNMSHKKNH